MPGGDGSIVINVTADDAEAQKRLNQLRREIEKTARALDTTTSNKNVIADQLKTARNEAQKLEAELANVTRQREEAAATMAGNAPGRAKFAMVDPEQYFAAREAYVELGQEQERINKELDVANKNAATLKDKEQEILAKMEAQTNQLVQQKEQAGAIERVLSQRMAAPQIAGAVGEVSTAMRKGVRSILRWGFGIRSAFILIRRLRSALIEGVKAFAEQDEKTQQSITGLKTALSGLKMAWGAAFAPILNAVAPLLERLIALLTAAANAISALFAIIGGNSTYKKTIKNNNDLADSYANAGGAAGSAAKEIMGFDEINKLSDKGGGGGGGDALKTLEYIDEAIDKLNDTFLGKLGIAIKDVFFEWSNVNPEQIAKKVLVGLAGLLGAALGISLGLGFGGTLLLTLAGVVFGLVISALIFNNDGKLSKSEILDMVILAINAILGGVLGFAMTHSFKGAMIGASIGAGLWVAIKALKLKKDNPENGVTSSAFLTIINGIVAAGIVFNLMPSVPGALLGAIIGVGLTLGLIAMKIKQEKTDAFYATELGKQVDEIKKKVEDVLSVDEDLTIRINSITGEVDEQTLVNLGAAQQLLDDIFTLDENEGKTSAELEILKEKVEAFNALGLGDIQVQFDDTTGHITQTRKEVQALLDDLLKQYQIKAMEDAYVESFKAQYEATENVTNATNAANEASAALETATANLTTTQEAYNAALAEYTKYSGEFESAGAGAGISEEAIAAAESLAQTTSALDAAKTAYEETRGAAESAEQALASSKETYDTATEKVRGLGEALVGLKTDAEGSGENFDAGFADGVLDNISEAEKATREAAEAALESLRNTLETHSPSKATMEMGEDLMEGLSLGVQKGQQGVISVLQSAMNAALTVVQDSVNAMIKIWRSDWGRPMIHLPVFGLAGMFDFRTGQTPQVVVQDWVWAAKGGIVDGATLIGAGEAGKEAIVPLERNTEWINLVAEGLIDKITQSNKLADYISGMNLPALVMGQTVPPRALNGSGSIFSDGDIERLVSGISAALGGGDGYGEQTIKLYLDGKQIAETVTKHQRRMERGFA